MARQFSGIHKRGQPFNYNPFHNILNFRTTEFWYHETTNRSLPEKIATDNHFINDLAQNLYISVNGTGSFVFNWFGYKTIIIDKSLQKKNIDLGKKNQLQTRKTLGCRY